MRSALTYLLIFLNGALSAQVSYIPGSHSTAAAVGSGAPGLPTLNYTPLAGTDRLLLFVLSYERDHSGAKGSNWADPGSVGGADPTVDFGGVSMTKVRAARYYQYQGPQAVGNATMTIEVIVYGMLEADIPVGLNTFTVSGINNPGHSGDEAVMSAMMFENVMGMTYLGSTGCEDCNAISLTGLDPMATTNMIYSVVGAGSDRDISSGAGHSLIASTKVANAGGAFGKKNENDGMALGAQYVAGTTALQTAAFSMTGAADMFGNVEMAFRIIAPVVLPVEFLSFDGANEGSDNRLQWVTATEVNNDRYEIERSSNGFHWLTIGEVEGQGNALVESYYEYLDEDAKCNNCYYRLKQVDYDGEFEYSPVIVLQTNRETSFEMYPNPAVNFVNIDVPQGAVSARVFDAAGMVVLSLSLEEQTQVQVDVAALARGQYFVVLSGASGAVTERLIKL